MNGLLEFAAKYFPELEKVAEAGDGASQDDDLLKVLQLLKTKKEKKPSPQKKQKKIHEKNRANVQRHLPRPILHPKWYPQPKCAHIQECYLPKKATLPHPERSKSKRSTVKTSNLKTGTVINNVSSALEKFKVKREKFLIYLQQLQDELTELNLPSISKEEMIPKGKKKNKKEKSESKQMGATKSKKAPKKKKLGKKKLSKKKPLVIENVVHFSSDSSTFSFSDSENIY
ncbi:uncharacterized protein [Halyomorpha halys]|uniref:uncharacterized protein n=1 Tax=Halyomorpha halys TaxID=286706 RepID=UPI0006D50954|nr:uncharacterized protein LOC106684607 [Halyomorpha halys]